MSDNPLVSIVIPVYNGSAYLSQAIDSALRQTYEQIEVLVINDGSTDQGATERVALAYGDRIRYFCKPNGGVASALNLGIRVMKGQYFSWLSHDDLYFPNKIELQVRKSQIYADNVIVFGDTETIDCNGRTLGDVRLAPLLRSDKSFLLLLLEHSFLNGCTLLIPRPCFEGIGFFRETLRTAQDADMWFRMQRQFLFVHIPELLVQQRLHPDQGIIKLQVVATQEADGLFAQTIHDTTENELFQGGAYAEQYLALSMRFLVRGFKRAAIAARQRARRYRAPLGTHLKAWVLALAVSGIGGVVVVLRHSHWGRTVLDRLRTAIRNRKRSI